MSEVTPQGKAAREKFDQDIEADRVVLLDRVRAESLTMEDLFEEADRIAYESRVRREALWKLIESGDIAISAERIIVPLTKAPGSIPYAGPGPEYQANTIEISPGGVGFIRTEASRESDVDPKVKRKPWIQP